MMIDELSLIASAGFLLWTIGLLPLWKETASRSFIAFAAFSTILTGYCGICHAECHSYPLYHFWGTVIWLLLLWLAVHHASYRMFRDEPYMLWAPVVVIFCAALLVVGRENWPPYRQLFLDVRAVILVGISFIAILTVSLRRQHVLGRAMWFRYFYYWVPLVGLVFIETAASVLYIYNDHVTDTFRWVYAIYAFCCGAMTLVESLRARRISGDDVTPL